MRKSPIHHSVRGHTREGKYIHEYERGSGVKRQRKSRVVGSKQIGIEGDAPTQTKSMVKKILSKIPPQHIHDLKIEFRHRDTDPMFQMHGMHGRYIKETKTLRLQPLKSLKSRVVYHEIGHHVYNNFLTSDEREQWEDISRNVADRSIPSWMPKSFRPEEYFAELYCSEYTSSALVSKRFAPIEVAEFMDNVLF